MNNKSKTVVLSSLLIGGGVAFANIAGGGYQPAPTPTAPITAPVQSAPVTAETEYAPIVIPATPQTGTTVPAVTTTPAVQRMLLTAKSGEEVTLKQTVQMNMRIVDMQMTGEMAEEGSLNKDELAEMNEMFAAMEEMGEGGEIILRIGEVFADGSRELISSSSAPMPDGSTYTVNIIQRMMPDGTVVSSRIESDNADIQAMYDSMNIDELAKNGVLDSGTDNTVYGMALREGETKSTTQTVDMENLIGGMMAAGMGLAAQEMSADEQEEFAAFMSEMQFDSEPMTMRTTTTYNGLNDAGLPTFSSRAETDDWKMKVNMPEMDDVEDFTMNFSIELLGMTADSLSSYALNGLPMYSKSTTDMTMKMTMDMGEELGGMSMTMQMAPVITLEAVR